jgi:GntR family transcriptional regulator, transcriptional repressor for pyruvate dehydrogenase complex
VPSGRDLAERLAVSRSPVREAVSVLESAGMVKMNPGKGVFWINRLNDILGEDKTVLVERLEVRQGIECQAASLSAGSRSEVDLKEIKSAYQRSERFLRHGQRTAMVASSGRRPVPRGSSSSIPAVNA